jgi:hypothetical protein
MKYVVTPSQFEILKRQIEPSDVAVQNICNSEKFCSAQGKITFGQLRAIVESATKKRIFKHVGEGGFKATLRILPWFLPQLTIAGFIGSATRALNKIFRPTLTETTKYRTWWGKAVMKAFDLVEGDLNLEDPLSRIFFISDGLMTMLDEKYKLKFAQYIANIASLQPDDKEVPEFFVENELRRWLNEKFLLDPPLGPKTKFDKMKIKVTESELVNIIKRIVESDDDDDDIRSRMKRRHGALLSIIQDEVAQESDPDNFSDEFEFADNILSWSIDKFISQPGNEWLEDRHDELLDYAKEEFGEELFEVYRDIAHEDYEDDDDEDFDM